MKVRMAEPVALMEAPATDEVQRWGGISVPGHVVG